jgi:hypothetical protein
MTTDDASDRSLATNPVEGRPTNRMNVAFGPFSEIEIEVPGDEFAELAAVAAELAAIN